LIDRRTLLFSAIATAAAPVLAQADLSPARIETLAPDEWLGSDPVRVRVWLPAGYDENAIAHRTLYLLDGQYAFADDSDGVNFSTDRRIQRLASTGTIPPTLIVAIDNRGYQRFLQYMPQAIYELSEGALRDAIEAEIARTGGQPLVFSQFVEYLDTRLKPYVDARYRTRPGRLDTAIFGASMAGVASGALFVEAQKTFGLAACLSPNWAIYDVNMIDHPQLLDIWPEYFAQLGEPAGRRLWLDHGTQMMDAGMAPHQTGIANRLTELGWERGCNLQTRVYDAGHAYAQTATQMDEVLSWLLA
jgi:enterochelin esterase-like enzyme